MRKLTYAAVVLPILLVATAPAHAGDGRAFHSSRPVSPHAGLVSPGAVLVTPHPVLVAPPHLCWPAGVRRGRCRDAFLADSLRLPISRLHLSDPHCIRAVLRATRACVLVLLH
jgi:hypothetical protein